MQKRMKQECFILFCFINVAPGNFLLNILGDNSLIAYVSSMRRFFPKSETEKRKVKQVSANNTEHIDNQILRRI